MVTALSVISHNTVVLATKIRETIFAQFTIVLQMTKNKSHYGPLYESRKQAAQSVV